MLHTADHLARAGHSIMAWQDFHVAAARERLSDAALSKVQAAADAISPPLQDARPWVTRRIELEGVAK